MAGGELTMLKRWDLSPVDPSSFDPTEPPGRPEEPAQGASLGARQAADAVKIARPGGRTLA